MEILANLADSFELIVALVLIALGYFRGRRNERVHLADLKRREAELHNILVFATRYPPLGRGTLDPTLVSGCVVLAADYFKMFVAGLRKLVGGRFNAFETLVDRARREAVLRMKEQAQAAGCDMIFNVRVETTQINNGARGGSSTVEVFAYGTAFVRSDGSVAESRLHHRFGPELPAAETLGSYDLEKNPVAKWVVLAWFFALSYPFAEATVFRTYLYIESPPWEVIWLLSLVGGVAASAILKRHQVPWGESIVIGLLWGLVLVAVLYFAALRINSLTDSSPHTETRYRLEKDLSLTPLDPDKTAVRFPDHAYYWAEQKTGSEYGFVVRCGLLGFCQVEREKYANQINGNWAKGSSSKPR